jgi:hypothetical protein
MSTSTASATASHLHQQKNGNASRRKHVRRQGQKASHGRRWSAHVNETSDAMDIKPDVFKEGSAAEIAHALKESSSHSRRRKASPFQSAMSMLNFYINRGGRNLSKSRKQTLEQAKKKLREEFGRAP